MNSNFFMSKRKTYELVILILFNFLAYFLWDSFTFIALFSFGFIWNWVISQEDLVNYSNSKRYRFSTLKFVFAFHRFITKFSQNFPSILELPLNILPAGLFWLAIIYLNDADVPWWSVFLGSLSAELIALDSLFKKRKNLETP